ncbi:hypothetical protein AAVH_40005 [Aphelenchoides avenae]|nr:hypothetical protein AAVH_40005 [Aphelenchus avenae]
MYRDVIMLTSLFSIGMRSLTLFCFAALVVTVAPLSCWQSHPINGQESPLNTIQCPLAAFCSKKIIGDMIYR